MKKISRVACVIGALAIICGMSGCSSDGGSSGETTEQTTITKNTDGTVTIKFQESGDGFLGTNGKISTDTTNAAGLAASNGYYYQNFPSSANNDSETAYIKYILTTDTAGNYTLKVRYAFGGNCDYLRDAYVYVNGEKLTDESGDAQILQFDYTIKNWTTYNDATMTIPLIAGSNTILIEAALGTERYVTYNSSWANWDELESVPEDGKIRGVTVSLANIDYTSVTSTVAGVTLAAGKSDDAFNTFSVASENESYGTVSPKYTDLKTGSSITVKATPATGYKFDAWYGLSGSNWIGSNDAEYTFEISDDTSLKAHFIPENATALEGLVGYGAITDDNGTTYIITGGLGGEEITLSSKAELDNVVEKLSSDDPYIVKITGTLTTEDNVSVKYDIGSNKTIYGDTENQGRLKNLEFVVSGNNVIIRNMMFGEVISDNYWKGTADDALSLNSATHVWIDHCEFQSHLSPQNNDGTTLSYSSGKTDAKDETAFKKDFYDGLLDIKNGSAFVSISNCYFHDHWKACLCGSSDVTENGDSKMRLTFYNNYWENINARQPLFRYGKAHVFSSYFYESSSETSGSATGINCRAGSSVYIDNNYFENIKTPIGYYNDESASKTGYWVNKSNTFDSCTNSVESSSTSYKPPYEWSATSAADSKKNLPGSVGVGILTASDLQ